MQRAAWIPALAVPVLIFWLAGSLVGGWIPGVEAAGRSERAALAIRDPVHPTEQLASWAFALPRLDAAYNEVATFTQRSRSGFGYSNDHRDAFRAELSRLLSRYETVDLFFMAHTNSYVGWVASLPHEQLGRIRLVYNSGCNNGKQGQEWLDLGIGAYVAHPQAAAHAPFFFSFFRRWHAGQPLAAAVEASNDDADRFWAFSSMVGLVAEAEKWFDSRGTLWGEPDLRMEAVR